MAIPWTPRAYSLEAARFMVSHPAAGLFLDPGLGKTSITLAAYQTLRMQKIVKRLLVIAPLRPAQLTWPAEIAKWADFAGLSVRVLHGRGKYLEDPPDVSVINPEGLSWLLQNAPKPWPWEMLVVDESTKFKHANTQRFKILRKLLPNFKRRYILTGTPVPNGLLDLFGQVYVLDLGEALGKYITHYKLNYFIPPPYGQFVWTLQYGAEERIYEKLRPLVLRMAADDLLEMPPLVKNVVKVELPASARGHYAEMEEQLITELSQQTIVAANAGVALMKCRQIANGGVFTADKGHPRPWAKLHDAKTEAVVDLVEERGGKPTLVGYEFQHDLERLQKAFPSAPHLGGGVSTTKAADVVAAWNMGALPVLLVQPQSAAHGLNLQYPGASIILYSLPQDLELVDQLIARVWRQGQTQKVVVHFVCAQGTVDETILKLLEKKTRVQGALLDALKEDLT